MNGKPTRNQEIFRRITVYSLMVITVLSLAVVLTFNILGYRLDFGSRTIEQTGLVQYDSFPRGATVSVDGKDLANTPTKATVSPGQRQFAMKLDGYELWQKNLDIASSTVTHLSYARLVPVNKVISQVYQFSHLQSLKFSPQNDRLIAFNQDDGGQISVVWGDVGDGANLKFKPTNIDGLIADLYPVEAGSGQSFEVLSWDQSSKFVMVKHSYLDTERKPQTSWLRFDRSNHQSVIDLSRVVGLAVKDMRFMSGNELVVLLENGDLRHLDVNRQAISRPLISDIDSFSVDQLGTVAFTGKQADLAVAGIWRKDWLKPQIIHTNEGADRSNSLFIATSRYYNQDTIVVASGPVVYSYRGSLPRTDQALRELISSGRSFSFGRQLERLSISGNGRFVVAANSTGYMSFDLERLVVSQNIRLNGSSKLSWLDGYHLQTVDPEGFLLMQEFDGNNTHQLMPATDLYDAHLSSDGKFTYSLISDGDGDQRQMTLTQLAMRAR